MKHLWLWTLFIVAYGMFSIKSHAAEATDLVSQATVYPLDLSPQGR